MTSREIEQAVRRCNFRRRWPWLVFWGVVAALFIAGSLTMSPRITPGALKTDAQSSALAICNAVHGYKMDFDRLPRPVSGVTGHDWDTDSGELEQIISILKGLEVNQNPRQTDYLGDIREAKMTKSGHLSGIAVNRESVAIVDPWGSPYRIRLDGDGDGFVADPANPGARLKEIVIVWSAGKDGDPPTWEDNAGSWNR
jgi:hypothetical protein